MRKILHSCTLLLKKTREKIRELARVIGLLVAAVAAMRLGKLYYKKLKNAKIAALQNNYGNFDK